MIRVNGFEAFSANSNQTLQPYHQLVVYTGNGTGTYTYTLPQTVAAAAFGSQAPAGQRLIVRHAGSAVGVISVEKHASDTGIYLSSATAVTSFSMMAGQAVELMSAGNGYWFMVDGSNFFDTWDDLEMLTAARAASSTSATLASIGTGVEVWKFQPSTIGGADKWLMGQRQITHGWDKQAVQWHVHFTPATSLAATGTGIVITWTMIWTVVHPGNGMIRYDQTDVVMTYSLSSGTMLTDTNYNASTGGNNSPTTMSNAVPSAMVLARLELTSVTNNGVNQTTEMFLNGWDAHIKLRKRGTINAFPEP